MGTHHVVYCVVSASLGWQFPLLARGFEASVCSLFGGDTSIWKNVGQNQTASNLLQTTKKRYYFFKKWAEVKICSFFLWNNTFFPQKMCIIIYGLNALYLATQLYLRTPPASHSPEATVAKCCTCAIFSYKNTFFPQKICTCAFFVVPLHSLSKRKLHGGYSSAGRASDCGSECRGFEPH